MDSKYLKAILRRAAAFEKLSNRVEALQDYTTACLIEEFKMESTIQSADRVLRSLATEKVKERMEDLKNNESLPSPSFISAYLGSFRFDYCERLTSLALDNSSQGDLKMANVRDALKKKDWDSAYAFCKEALEAGLLNADIHALALNLYGTFNFLMGRTENAITAYKKSLELDSTNTNTLIKLGSVMMEKVEEKGLENALQWFEKALSVGGGDRDPDVYYHRGQIYFLVQEYEKALLDYEKSISMDGNFLFALIQKAVVLYRLGRVEESEAEFEKIHKQFPASADPHYYYGEIMLDRQKIEESMREFDEAISLDPSLPLPHLNKASVLHR